MTDLILTADEANRKTCTRCGETKPVSEFYRARRSGKAAAQCKPCRRATVDGRRKKRPVLTVLDQRRYKLRRRYGLDAEDYAALMDRQGSVCAICGTSPNGVALSVDHDHTSGFIRGLLCHPCNTAIGYFERMVPALPKVLSYLMSPPALEMNGRRVKNPKTR